MIGRWIARLDQYHFKTVHRPRTQHRNAVGLSKRTNDYVHRENIVETLPEVSKGFSFMSQDDYENLPTVPYIDKHGKFIPNHPEVPAEARAQLPMLYILKRQPKEKPATDQSFSSIPWYPEVQWETTPTSIDAIVVLEGHFPQGLYLCRQELRSYNFGVQDAPGEARIDERASLVVEFGTPMQKPIQLFGMIDTGWGVSILSLMHTRKSHPRMS